MAVAERVLLLSCYELGHQPLHVASAAGFLRAAGHQVSACDVAVETLDDRLIDEAQLVAIAVPMHTAMRIAVRLVDRVRRRRRVPIALFGLYAPLCAGSLPPGSVDHAVGGEFEEELVRIAAGAPSGRQIILDRLRFPLPARDLLPPLDRYARLWIAGEERLAGYVEATRGCVHRCRHCPVPAVYDGRIRVVQREVMVEDVGQLHAMGMRHLTFGDPDFLNAPPHALAAARAVHARFPELTFDVTTKIEHILEHSALLAELRSLGLLFVTTAVESTSERVLRILDKGHTHGDTRAAIAALRSLGIEVRPSLLPFTPWSTLRDYLDLLEFVAAEHLLDSVDPVQLTIRLLVPPGSLLLQRDELAAHLTGYDAAAFSHRWRHPDPGMDQLQEELAAAVASLTDAGVAPRLVHARIREIAAIAAARTGFEWTPGPIPPTATVPAPPRLSEPWFCCAEPTGAQLHHVVTRRPANAGAAVHP